MPTGEIFIIIVSSILLILITCLPLIPAALIYRLFPKTSIKIKGPFRGLTLNASGAFAAYILILMMIYPLALKNYHLISSFYYPTWHLEANMLFYDKEGNQQKFRSKDEQINVLLIPETYQVSNGTARILVPWKSGEKLPFIKIEVPGWGEGELNISNMTEGQNYTIDNFKKSIHISDPLIIRESPPPENYDANVAGKQINLSRK